MFDFIKNLFQYKAKSIEEFVEVMRRENCGSIAVNPRLRTKGGSQSAVVGLITDFQYMLEFTAMTPRGRKIIYREQLFERFGSDRGFSDSEERRNAAIKLFLLGEQKVKGLQEKLPGVSVDLIGPNGSMDATLYAKLHKDAAKYKVSV